MANYRAMARQAAKRHGLDPEIFERQINAESGFRPDAQSPAGARGIAQIMPATAKGWHVNPDDPRASLNAAAANMSRYVQQFGSYDKALRAYNAGPGNVEKSKGFGETNAYVAKILHGTDPGSSSSAGGGSGAPGPLFDTTKTSTSRRLVSPAIDNESARAALVFNFLSPSSHDSKNLLGFVGQAQALKDVPAQYATDTTVTKGASTGGAAGAGDLGAQAPAPTQTGTAAFEGKQVAGWIAPILQYARERGWKGTVNSGFRSLADQTRIYNSGVRPAAKPGTSNHEGAEWPRGAIDVSDAAKLSAILKRSPYASRLQWAGAKDPVHFSHPHGGSY